MGKIIFFDIDGTLLDHDKLLAPSTKAAIETLKENGVYVAIATGRSPYMFERLRVELGIESYVSFNGQYVVFENEVIYKRPLPTNELEKLFTYSAKKEQPLVFLDEKKMVATTKDHPFIEEAIGSLKFPHPEENPHYYRQNEVYQALLFCEENGEEPYTKDFPEFDFVRWHPYCTDILPAGGSKAEGIKRMVMKLGFKMSDTYAFGDGLNDLEMLQAVGTGVAMGNAVEELKEIADYVTKAVDEDGIAKGLKELKLI